MFDNSRLSEQNIYCERNKILLSQRYNHSPKAYVHTYGCQQNVSDSEKIKGLLNLSGYTFTDSITDADFILFNTCAIREGAEAKIFGNVGELKLKKKLNPNIIISLCGCMVQQQRIVERIKTSYPFVDLIFGTHMIDKFPVLLNDALTINKKVVRTDDGNGTIPEYVPTLRDDKTKANVPIMNGCNNFCTYCIVPYVRGREVSRSAVDIENEVRNLVLKGYKEITLLGQNVNSYGKNTGENVDFSDLLKCLNAIEGDFIIRFLTSHPKDCSHKLIDTIAECEKVCNHIHLPVQCGSDRILKLMNRNYTKEQYLELVSYAKEKIPDISFSSDIIVGFPDETYDDFLETVDLINKVKFSQLFTFIYSKRPGTKAALMEDKVSHKEKSKWLMELLDAQSKIGMEENSALIGKTMKVLVEGYGKSEENCLTGRTFNNTIVDFMGTNDDLGKFVNVKITKATPFATFGEMI